MDDIQYWFTLATAIFVLLVSLNKMGELESEIKELNGYKEKTQARLKSQFEVFLSEFVVPAVEEVSSGLEQDREPKRQMVHLYKVVSAALRIFGRDTYGTLSDTLVSYGVTLQEYEKDILHNPPLYIYKLSSGTITKKILILD